MPLEKIKQMYQAFKRVLENVQRYLSAFFLNH